MDGNRPNESYRIDVVHGEGIGEGYAGAGPPSIKKNPNGKGKGKVYESTTELDGITGTTTTVKWNEKKGVWEVVQHFPKGQGFNNYRKDYDNQDGGKGKGKGPAQ